MNFKKMVAVVILVSMNLNFLAYAYDPVKLSTVHMDVRTRGIISHFVKKRVDRFMSFSYSEQIKVLDIADRKYTHLIRKFENWTDERFSKKQKRAIALLNHFSHSDNEATEVDPALALTPHEVNLLAESSLSKPIQVQFDSTRSLPSRTAMIADLKAKKLELSGYREKFAARHSTKLNRKIAEMDVADFATAMVLLVLGAAGIAMLVLGSLALVGSFGLAAGPAIALITIGSLCIAVMAGMSWMFFPQLGDGLPITND